MAGSWVLDDNGTPSEASDDILRETSSDSGAILYTPTGDFPAGFTFRYRTPAGDTGDYPAKHYAQVLLEVNRAGAPEDYPYVALRIEPDRLGIVYYTGFGMEEIESVDAVTKAGKWYTVRVRGMVGGAGVCVALERFGEEEGDTVAILAQSLPLSALPGCGGDAIGFTVGAAADYEFQLVGRADALDASGYFVDWDHDAYGRKIAETVYDDGATVSAQTLYVWDGWRLVAEVDGLTGKQLANYVHGPAYIDDMVASFRDLDGDGAFDDANEQRYHLTDHQHSSVALLGPGGDVLERYAYDAFGVPTALDPSGTPLPDGTAIGNHHLYTGREWLPGPGLYDLRNRNYDPANGRFLTNDPIGNFGDMNNLGNPYTYVGNNPGAFVDPYGARNRLAIYFHRHYGALLRAPRRQSGRR